MQGGANRAEVADGFTERGRRDLAGSQRRGQALGGEDFAHRGFDERLTAKVEAADDDAFGVETVDEESERLAETATERGEYEAGGGVAGLRGLVDGLGGGVAGLPFAPVGRPLIVG